MAQILRNGVAAALVAAALTLAQPPVKFTVPVTYYKLPNGLRVVMSPDSTAPTAVIAVYYNIGFRIEQKDRTGFAHLFEHMMFQGSRNLGKTEFIKLVQSNGGQLNGSTRFDFTNYFEVVPSNKLETMLWAEADRMRGLAITEENLDNQKGVVSNEVKVNVINSPYGGFPWLDLPQVANTNWYNAHNFYGDLTDLQKATLDEVKQFFKTYYAPNNAVLAIVGDIDVESAKKMVEKYFAGIPSSPHPEIPDLTEPRQTEEKHGSINRPLAKRPAYAFGYHMPPRNTPEYFAMAIIDQIVLQGADSWLSEELVNKRGITDQISGGINWPLGDMFNYDGPMLWMANLIHDPGTAPEQITVAIDGVLARLTDKPVEKATVDRALVKLRSDFYSSLTGFGGFGRADLLASFALFDDNPARINQLEDEFRKVTPELIQKTAREYLRRTNRTVMTVIPGPEKKPA
jgi:predicted Zn-dependent peptidase